MSQCSTKSFYLAGEALSREIETMPASTTRPDDINTREVKDALKN